MLEVCSNLCKYCLVQVLMDIYKFANFKTLKYKCFIFSLSYIIIYFEES